MNIYFLNPTVDNHAPYIREGRCMQKASSWATAWPPISLGVLAEIAKPFGNVRFLDGNVEKITLNQLLNDIKEFKADIVLFNTGFPSINQDMQVAQAVKKAFPHATVIAFGVYFTLLEKEGYAQYPFLDFCIYGEPEETFKEILQEIKLKKNNFENIKGLIFRKNEDIYITPKRPLQHDMDAIPFPARDLFKNDLYRLPHNGKSYTLINAGRGCPYSCTYCVVAPHFGKKTRKHSVKYIIDEIQECKRRYGIEEFLFWDEVFTMDRNFAIEICDNIINDGLNISWAASTRVDLVDYELLCKMKAAGCYLLGLGIESGNQEILNNAKKGQTIEEIKKCVFLAKKAGIKTMGHFIFGLPGETKETAEETIKFIHNLKLDFIQSYCAVPYPKTEFGEMAREQKWVDSEKWSDYNFGGQSIVHNKTISAEDVTLFRDKSFRKFYYRPSFIINLLKDYSIQHIIKMNQFSEWIKTARKS